MAKMDIRKHYLFHEFYARMKAICLSAFEWEGLPETCNERFLEKTLFENGEAIFVEDENLGFLNLRVAPSGNLNVYNEPVSFRAYSTGYDRDFSASDCVWILNNYVRKSTDSTILYFAERLTNAELTLQVNMNAQKTPILIKCDEKQRFTLENIYNQYTGDKPVILGMKSLQEKPLDVITTGAPYLVDKIREEKKAIWNEFLEFIGINTNPSDDKRERLINVEVNANNEQVTAQAEIMLLCRKQACERINDMYGLNVSVKRRFVNEGGVNLWPVTQSNSEPSLTAV